MERVFHLRFGSKFLDSGLQLSKTQLLKDGEAYMKKCIKKLVAVFRIWIWIWILKFLGLPDPDLLVRGTDPDPPIIKQK
jgi:hypothetical protein